MWGIRYNYLHYYCAWVLHGMSKGWGRRHYERNTASKGSGDEDTGQATSFVIVVGSFSLVVFVFGVSFRGDVLPMCRNGGSNEGPSSCDYPTGGWSCDRALWDGSVLWFDDEIKPWLVWEDNLTQMAFLVCELIILLMMDNP